jgi:hypothetical protein
MSAVALYRTHSFDGSSMSVPDRPETPHGIEYSTRDDGSNFFVDLTFLGLPLWYPEPRLVGIDGVVLGQPDS